MTTRHPKKHVPLATMPAITDWTSIGSARHRNSMLQHSARRRAARTRTHKPQSRCWRKNAIGGKWTACPKQCWPKRYGNCQGKGGDQCFSPIWISLSMTSLFCLSSKGKALMNIIPSRWTELRPTTLPPFAREARRPHRSEEHTSELQSLMRISYADFCLKQKNK